MLDADEQALQELITDVIRNIQDNEGWAKVSEVSTFIKKQSGIGCQSLSYRTFADLLVALDGYELQKFGRIWQVKLLNACQ